MTEPLSDALVLFGATGDLAYQQIFPALHAMSRRGRLDVPVVCTSRQPSTVDQMRQRARESITAHGGLDREAFEHLSSKLRYVSGDYQQPATFTELRRVLGSAQHPLFYLAIPPNLFDDVVAGLAASGCAAGSRVVVEKPFGRDLASARELNRAIHRSFPESAVYRIDHFLGKEPVQNLMYFRFTNVFMEPMWRAAYIAGVTITMSESFGVRGRGKFYEEVGAIRDVFQNHLLQILAIVCMEPPHDDSAAAIDAAKVRLLEAVRPLRPEDVVRGQYAGYRQEPGVAPDSQVETYAAARVSIENPRWAGVPIVIRTGKCLADTFTEVRVRFRRPASELFDAEQTGDPNEMVFRLSPDVMIGLSARIKAPGEGMVGTSAQLVDHHQPGDEMRPYERLLGDAMRGDHTLFGSESGVEAAWRVVDGVLGPEQPLYPYEPGSSGPAQ